MECWSLMETWCYGQGLRVSNERTCSDEMTRGRHFGMLKRVAQRKRSRLEKGALLKQRPGEGTGLSQGSSWP